jgi:hypothetical protein
MQPSGGLAGDIIFSLIGMDSFTLEPIPTKLYGEKADGWDKLYHFLKKQVPNNPIIGISGWQWGVDQIPGVEYKDRWKAFDSYAHQSIMRTFTQRANARAPYAEDTTVINTMLRFIGIKLWPFELPFKERKYKLDYDRRMTNLRRQVEKLNREYERYRGTPEEQAVKIRISKELLKLRRIEEEYLLGDRGLRRLKENVEDPREIWESQQ